MRLLIAAVLALIPACAQQQRVEEAGRVEVVWSRTEDVHRTCRQLSRRTALFQILGCSKWSEPAQPGEPRTCTIYVPEPRDERDVQRFATLGHELMHCFDGNWHDRWGRMNVPRQAAAGSGTSASGGAAAAD